MAPISIRTSTVAEALFAWKGSDIKLHGSQRKILKKICRRILKERDVTDKQLEKVKYILDYKKEEIQEKLREFDPNCKFLENMDSEDVVVTVPNGPEEDKEVSEVREKYKLLSKRNIARALLEYKKKKGESEISDRDAEKSTAKAICKYIFKTKHPHKRFIAKVRSVLNVRQYELSKILEELHPHGTYFHGSVPLRKKKAAAVEDLENLTDINEVDEPQPLIKKKQKQPAQQVAPPAPPPQSPAVVTTEPTTTDIPTTSAAAAPKPYRQVPSALNDHLYTRHWSERGLHEFPLTLASSYILFDTTDTDEYTRKSDNEEDEEEENEKDKDEEKKDDDDGNDSDEIDVCGLSSDDDNDVNDKKPPSVKIGSSSWHCATERAYEQMHECAEIIDKEVHNKRDPMWHEKIDRKHWSKDKSKLFDSVLELLNEDMLVRHSSKGTKRELVLRRTSIDRCANKMRFLLASIDWNWEILSWLHRLLTHYLPADVLTSYTEMIQTLRLYRPDLVDKLIRVSADASTSEENLQRVMTRRPWDPAVTTVSIHQGALKFSTSIAFIFVPCVRAQQSYASTSRRFRHWASIFSQIQNSKIITVSREQTDNDQLDFSKEGTLMKAPLAVGDIVHNTVRSIIWKAREARAVRKDRKIVLVGWNVTSVLNCYVSMCVEIDATICLGYPMQHLGGMRGGPDDQLCGVTTPTFFVTGTNAKLSHPSDIEVMRRQVFNDAPTGALVVNGADDHLHVCDEVKTKHNVTQSCVDRIIVDHAVEFLKKQFEPDKARKKPPTMLSKRIRSKESLEGDGVHKIGDLNRFENQRRTSLMMPAEAADHMRNSLRGSRKEDQPAHYSSGSSGSLRITASSIPTATHHANTSSTSNAATAGKLTVNLSSDKGTYQTPFAAGPKHVFKAAGRNKDDQQQDKTSSSATTDNSKRGSVDDDELEAAVAMITGGFDNDYDYTSPTSFSGSEPVTPDVQQHQTSPLESAYKVPPSTLMNNTNTDGGDTSSQLRTTSPGTSHVTDVTASASARASAWLRHDRETMEATATLEKLAGGNSGGLQRSVPRTRGGRTLAGFSKRGTRVGLATRGGSSLSKGLRTRGGGGNTASRFPPKQPVRFSKDRSQGSNDQPLSYVWPSTTSSSGSPSTTSSTDHVASPKVVQQKAPTIISAPPPKPQIVQQRSTPLKIVTCQSFADTVFGTGPASTTVKNISSSSSSSFKRPQSQKFGHAVPVVSRYPPSVVTSVGNTKSSATSSTTSAAKVQQRSKSLGGSPTPPATSGFNVVGLKTSPITSSKNDADDVFKSPMIAKPSPLSKKPISSDTKKSTTPTTTIILSSDSSPPPAAKPSTNADLGSSSAISDIFLTLEPVANPVQQPAATSSKPAAVIKPSAHAVAARAVTIGQTKPVVADTTSSKFVQNTPISALTAMNKVLATAVVPSVPGSSASNTPAANQGSKTSSETSSQPTQITITLDPFDDSNSSQ